MNTYKIDIGEKKKFVATKTPLKMAWLILQGEDSERVVPTTEAGREQLPLTTGCTHPGYATKFRFCRISDRPDYRLI